MGWALAQLFVLLRKKYRTCSPMANRCDMDGLHAFTG